MSTPDDFNGTNKLDVRDSPPDGSAFTAAPAPDGAPNVLVVLFDDTGIAAWSPYGGRIDMPTMDKLAADGLTYSQRHTTALCSRRARRSWPDATTTSTDSRRSPKPPTRVFVAHPAQQCHPSPPCCATPGTAPASTIYLMNRAYFTDNPPYSIPSYSCWIERRRKCGQGRLGPPILVVASWPLWAIRDGPNARFSVCWGHTKVSAVARCGSCRRCAETAPTGTQ